MRIGLAPSRIFGNCPARYRQESYATIRGNDIRKHRGPLCYIAIGAIKAHVPAIRSGETFMNHVSCPGCKEADGSMAKVVFVLGRHELRKTVSILSARNWYRRLEDEETEEKGIRMQCWQYAKEGKRVKARRLARKLQKTMEKEQAAS